jgi:hypothetical protein
MSDGSGKAVGAAAGLLAAVGMLFARVGDDCARGGSSAARMGDGVALSGARVGDDVAFAGGGLGRAGDDLALGGGLGAGDDLVLGGHAGGVGEELGATGGLHGTHGRLGRTGALGGGALRSAESEGLTRVAAVVDDGATFGDEVLSTVVEEAIVATIDVADSSSFDEPDRPPLGSVETRRPADRIRSEVWVFDARADQPGVLRSRVALDRALRAAEESVLLVVAGSEPNDAELLTERVRVPELLAFCAGLGRECVAIVCEGGDERCVDEAAAVARSVTDRVEMPGLLHDLQTRRDASQWAAAIAIYRLARGRTLRLAVNHAPR